MNAKSIFENVEIYVNQPQSSYEQINEESDKG